MRDRCYLAIEILCERVAWPGIPGVSFQRPRRILGRNTRELNSLEDGPYFRLGTNQRMDSAIIRVFWRLLSNAKKLAVSLLKEEKAPGGWRLSSIGSRLPLVAGNESLARRIDHPIFMDASFESRDSTRERPPDSETGVTIGWSCRRISVLPCASRVTSTYLIGCTKIIQRCQAKRNVFLIYHRSHSIIHTMIHRRFHRCYQVPCCKRT
ncbi:hypothetical protein BJX76DRAFT_4590 [Aspergillus varians]